MSAQLGNFCPLCTALFGELLSNCGQSQERCYINICKRCKHAVALREMVQRIGTLSLLYWCIHLPHGQIHSSKAEHKAEMLALIEDRDQQILKIQREANEQQMTDQRERSSDVSPATAREQVWTRSSGTDNSQ